MNDGTREKREVGKKDAPLNTRMAESDLRPIRQAAEAANLNMSTVVRECLMRYGQQTIIELAQDRQFQASGAYKSSGKRRLRQSPKAKDVSLEEMVSWKYQIASNTAANWIKLGRVAVDGAVIEDPKHMVPADAKDRVTKSS